jgi:hypothetical protein
VAYLAGEWVPANLGFGLVFLIAGLGAFLLGVYVIRAEAKRRAAETASLDEAARAEGATEEHH